MMPDHLAIVAHNDHYLVEFLIDGRWWPATDHRLRTRRWSNEQQARAWLGAVFDRYRHDYGESLDWDVPNVPVLEVQ